MIPSLVARGPLGLVLRNFSALAAAEILSRVITLAAIGFYARQLQREAFGYLGLSMAVVSYLGLVVSFGFDPVATRAIARDPGVAPRYATGIFSLRLVLAAVTYGALAVTLWLAPLPAPLKPLLAVDGLSLFAMAFHSTWVFQGLQQLHIVALGRIAQSLCFTIVVLALVRGPEGALWVVWSNVLGAAAFSVVLFARLPRHIGMFSLRLDFEFIKDLVRRSTLFAVIGAAGLVYAYSGLLLLGWWRPTGEVGVFSAVYRLTYGLLQAIAGLLLVAFVPALSAAWTEGPRQMRALHRDYARLSNFCAAAILVVFALFPAPLLEICFGEAYVSGAPTLRLLACCIAASFVSGPYVAALMAAGLDRILLCQTTGFSLLCLLLNVALIPRSGGEGAAAALLASIVAGTISSIYFYYRDIAAGPVSARVPAAGPLAEPQIPAA